MDRAGPVRIPVDIFVTDVLRCKTPKAHLEGKLVLVGAPSAGPQDLRNTPGGCAYPGVEIHTNLIAGMLDNTVKQQPPYVLGAQFVLLAVAGLGMALVLPLLNPLRASIATLVVLVALIDSNLAIWQYGTLVLSLASGLSMVPLLFVLNMSYGFLVESRSKKQIAGRFGQVVPPNWWTKWRATRTSARWRARAGSCPSCSTMFRDSRRLLGARSSESCRT